MYEFFNAWLVFRKSDTDYATCTVPSNIRLHQYTKPGETLSVLTAKVLESDVKNCKLPKERSVFVGLSNGEIVKQNGAKIFQPGDSTLNMQLDFRHDVANFQMGLKLHSDGKTVIINDFAYHNVASVKKSVHTTSKEFLLYVSDKCRELFGNKTVNVHQFTCHEGDFLGYKRSGQKNSTPNNIDDVDIDNLTQLFKYAEVTPIRRFRPETDHVSIVVESTDIEQVKKMMNRFVKNRQKRKLETKNIRKRSFTGTQPKRRRM